MHLGILHVDTDSIALGWVGSGEVIMRNPDKPAAVPIHREVAGYSYEIWKAKADEVHTFNLGVVMKIYYIFVYIIL